MLLKGLFYPLLRNKNKSLLLRAHYSTSPAIKEQKIKIRNYEINYLKVGHGPHHVFCAAGLFGTIWSDYKKQIEGFDRDKFSLVVWDPPGFGKSINLENKESMEIFFTQADIAYEFMKALQIPRYSLMGWSSGGGTVLLLAGNYPEVVNKVVAFGTSAFLSSQEIEYYKNLKNINHWPKPIKETMIQLYGEENFKNKINKFVQLLVDFYDSKNTLSEEFKRIKCPTLLLHGAKDPVVNSQHLKHLQSLVTNSRTHLYPDGGHNIHMQYADDFNKKVQEFLLEPNENNTTSN